MHKNVLLFGAGKSATVLIQYLLKNAAKQNWQIQVVDANIEVVEAKIKNHKNGLAFAFDIAADTEARQSLIANAAIVISLLPPALHILVAQDCIAYQRNLLTASYIDDATKQLAPAIKENNLLFLYEMGLDPGIDHMSAMQLIDNIHAQSGTITSFKSHCGGLVAPESDNNPWHYKVSWNPRNIIMAGKAGAQFLQNGKIIKQEYQNLFTPAQHIIVDAIDAIYSYFANRDSLSYIDTYKLNNVHTFIRTTLRHPDFIYGWNNIVALQLTNEEKVYQTDGKSLAQLFKEHLKKHNLDNWLGNIIMDNLNKTKQAAIQLSEIIDAEEIAKENANPTDAPQMLVDANGDLLIVDDIKNDNAATVANLLAKQNLDFKLLAYLGFMDELSFVNKGLCSAADILQFAVEQKLVLHPADKDMIVMQHEIEYSVANQTKSITSNLIVKGDDAIHTAMAKTVGLPLGIAAKLILNGTITTKGLQMPIQKEIYQPVLIELAKNGIVFNESES
jgi:saccharopine dehydrogenase-like NADP-dependent oxidoreductase